MRASIILICVLCGQHSHAPAHASGEDGLCPDHWSRETLREWERSEAARRLGRRCGSPAPLTLAQWLAIISSFKGECALCQTSSYAALGLLDPAKGLAAGNVFPTCLACQVHLQHGFEAALGRQCEQLARPILTVQEEDGEERSGEEKNLGGV